MFPLAGIDKFI